MQGLLRLRLRTCMISILLCPAGQSQSQIQLRVKGLGGETLLLEERKLKVIFQRDMYAVRKTIMAIFTVFHTSRRKRLSRTRRMDSAEYNEGSMDGHQ